MRSLYIVHIDSKDEGMRIIVSNGSPLPIYEQIVQQVKQAILTGEVVEGEPLPSIRHLARDLRVSVITTTRASHDLARDGFVVSVPGKGAFVGSVNPGLVREQARTAIEQDFAEAVGRARLAGLQRTELTALLNAALDAGLPPEPNRRRSCRGRSREVHRPSNVGTFRNRQVIDTANRLRSLQECQPNVRAGGSLGQDLADLGFH